MNYRSLTEINKINNSDFLKLIPQFKKKDVKTVDELIKKLETIKFIIPIDFDDDNFYIKENIIYIYSDYKKYLNLFGKLLENKYCYIPKIVYFNQIITQISHFDDIEGVVINPNPTDMDSLHFNKSEIFKLKETLKSLYISNETDLDDSILLDKMKDDEITDDLLEQVKKSKFIVPFESNIRINKPINFEYFVYPIQKIKAIDNNTEQYLCVFTNMFEYSLVQEQYQYNMILNYKDIIRIIKENNIDGVVINPDSNFYIKTKILEEL